MIVGKVDVVCMLENDFDVLDVFVCVYYNREYLEVIDDVLIVEYLKYFVFIIEGLYINFKVCFYCVLCWYVLMLVLYILFCCDCFSVDEICCICFGFEVGNNFWWFFSGWKDIVLG